MKDGKLYAGQLAVEIKHSIGFMVNVLEQGIEGAEGRVAILETACCIVAAGIRNVKDELELIEAYLADEKVETEA